MAKRRYVVEEKHHHSVIKNKDSLYNSNNHHHLAPFRMVCSKECNSSQVERAFEIYEDWFLCTCSPETQQNINAVVEYFSSKNKLNIAVKLISAERLSDIVHFPQISEKQDLLFSSAVQTEKNSVDKTAVTVARKQAGSTEETITQETWDDLTQYIWTTNLQSEIFSKIYKTYNSQFNFDNFYKNMQPENDVFWSRKAVLPLTTEEVIFLLEVSENRLRTQKQLSEEDVRVFFKDFCEKIEKLFAEVEANNRALISKLTTELGIEYGNTYELQRKSEEGETSNTEIKELTQAELAEWETSDEMGWMNFVQDSGKVEIENECNNQWKTKGKLDCFMRLSTTSGKNENKIRVVRNAWDVLDVLTCSNLFAKYYLESLESLPFRELSVILMPWNPFISRSNEFRVFYRKKEVIAIAQQSWYLVQSFTAEQIDKIIHSINDLARALSENFAYESAILDVFVLDFSELPPSFFGENAFKAFLIECNPWGAWASSGSSLFHWETNLSFLEPDYNFIYYSVPVQH